MFGLTLVRRSSYWAEPTTPTLSDAAPQSPAGLPWGVQPLLVHWPLSMIGLIASWLPAASLANQWIV